LYVEPLFVELLFVEHQYPRTFVRSVHPPHLLG
jgi:hypothetical protein